MVACLTGRSGQRSQGRADQTCQWPGVLGKEESRMIPGVLVGATGVKHLSFIPKREGFLGAGNRAGWKAMVSWTCLFSL